MSAVMTVFVVLTLGYLLGRVTIGGLSLGTSGIILVALVFGHWGYAIPKELQNLGLACFVTAVGLIAGPVFFRNFKRQALAYIALGAVIILVGALACLGVGAVLQIPTPLCVGILCGALTSTPGLAAALEAGGDAMASVGYGIAYPFGVLGVVLFVQLIPKLLPCDIQGEIAQLKAFSKKEGSEAGRELLRVDAHGFFPLSAVLVMGLLLGELSIPLPGGAFFSLGISGGPLLAGLVAGHLGQVGRLSLRVPGGTLNAIREFGLALFLLGAGLSAGNGFLAVLSQYGMGLFAGGVVMTLLPMAGGFLLARRLKIPVFTALGSICGGMTSTPALGSLIAVAGTDLVAASYAATYPVALICVILAAQAICVFF